MVEHQTAILGRGRRKGARPQVRGHVCLLHKLLEQLVRSLWQLVYGRQIDCAELARTVQPNLVFLSCLGLGLVKAKVEVRGLGNALLGIKASAPGPGMEG